MIDQAQPGDPDLDIDVSGFLLTTVVRTGDEFFVAGGGGDGWWIDDCGKRADVVTVESLEFVFGLGPVRQHLAEHYEKALRRWCDMRLPLRLVGAPNKETLISDGRTPLYLPRDPS